MKLRLGITLKKIVAGDVSIDLASDTDAVFKMFATIDMAHLDQTQLLNDPANRCRHHFVTAGRVTTMTPSTWAFLAGEVILAPFAMGLPYEWRITSQGNLESLFRDGVADAKSLQRRQQLIKSLIETPELIDTLYSILQIDASVKEAREQLEKMQRDAYASNWEGPVDPEVIIKSITPYFEFAEKLGEWLSLQITSSPDIPWMGRVIYKAAGEITQMIKDHFFQFSSYSLIIEDFYLEKDRERFWHRVEIIHGFTNDLCAYAAIAKLARGLRWETYPDVVDSPQPQLILKGGVSPQLLFNQTADKSPVDIRFSPDKPIAIVMGQNDSGKTTAGRTIGTLLLMAQVGIPLPITHMSFTPMAVRACQSLADMVIPQESGRVTEGQQYALRPGGMAKKSGRWAQGVRYLTKVFEDIRELFSLSHIPTFVIYDEALEGSRQKLSARFASAWALSLVQKAHSLIYFATHNQWFTHKHPLKELASHFTMRAGEYKLRSGIRPQHSDQAEIDLIQRHASHTLLQKFESLKEWPF